MAKKTKRTNQKARKNTPSAKRGGAGSRAAARSGAGARKRAAAKRSTGRKTAGAKAPKGKTRKAGAAKRPAAKTSAASRPAARKAAAKRPTSRKPAGTRPSRAAAPRRGGTGRESELAQTPETGRSVKGPTNPMPTRRSTGTPAGAGGMKLTPGLTRRRRQLREVEEGVPTPPSSLDMDRSPSAARSGRQGLRDARADHTEVSPEITAGDVDASWEDAYSVGDEAPGGDNPTPDQDRVDDIGRALGVEYQDNEELKASDKIAERDRKRWELDPASSEDYRERE